MRKDKRFMVIVQENHLDDSEQQPIQEQAVQDQLAFDDVNPMKKLN